MEREVIAWLLLIKAHILVHLKLLVIKHLTCIDEGWILLLQLWQDFIQFSAICVLHAALRLWGVCKEYIGSLTLVHCWAISVDCRLLLHFYLGCVVLFCLRIESISAVMSQGNSLLFSTFVLSCKLKAILVQNIPFVVVSLIQSGIQILQATQIVLIRWAVAKEVSSA